MPTITERLKNSWNAFLGRDPTYRNGYYGASYYPERRNGIIVNDGSIIDMIKNRIAVDAAQIDIKHVRKDEDNNYKEDLKSALNDVFSVSANVDQTGRAFIQDLVQSLLDEGYVAAVPIDTDVNPDTGSFNIRSIRVGQIIEWYPQHVRVRAFNEAIGRKQDIVVPKATTAIIENPFYSIMNAPNSTLQRLQLPYSLKSPLKQQQAEGRRKMIEDQLVGSKYGIAYIDATERITQLNRPVENNLWKEAQDLTAMLFNQLGLTESIFNGTATDSAMTNYYNRTIEPILAAITEEMERKFLTTTARTQHQAIIYMRDPFKLVTVTDISDIAQRFTQNEIMSSNEIRAKIGLKPVDDEAANQLINKNINKVGESTLRSPDDNPEPGFQNASESTDEE